MTAVCCSGRCMGCCSSRRALVRRAQCRAMLPVLLVLLGAGWGTAWGGAWLGWVLLGAALGGGLQDKLGRRAVLALSPPLQVATALMHGLVVHGGPEAEGVGAVAARAVRSACAGVALGVAVPAALFYLAELWRPRRRGAACCVPTLAVVAGRSLAYGLEHDGVLGERLAALAGVAPALLGLVLLLLLAPPSPYWLALRGREVALGRALARVRGLRDERGARDEADDVADTVREQRASACAGNARGPVLAVLLVGALPLAGLPLLEEHLPLVLPADAVADVPAWLVRVAVGGALAAALLGVAALVDVAGRRPLLVAACLVLAAGHATLGYFHWYLGVPLPAAAAVARYITLGAVLAAALAGAALAALAWVVVAEVLPMRAKAWLPALALLVNVLLQAAVDAVRLALPRVVDVRRDGFPGGRVWPASWCYAHALWALLLAALLGCLLPETKGFSLAQLHEVFRGPNRQTLQTRL